MMLKIVIFLAGIAHIYRKLCYYIKHFCSHCPQHRWLICICFFFISNDVHCLLEWKKILSHGGSQCIKSSETKDSFLHFKYNNFKSVNSWVCEFIIRHFLLSNVWGRGLFYCPTYRGNCLEVFCIYAFLHICTLFISGSACTYSCINWPLSYHNHQQLWAGIFL